LTIQFCDKVDTENLASLEEVVATAFGNRNGIFGNLW